MPAATKVRRTQKVALILAIALGGCGKMKQNDPKEATRIRVEAKRQKAACASSTAYDRLKGLLFDQAIEAELDNRSSLDSLADYSFARVENPLVTGSDPGLDMTRCSGHFVLEIPPGAEVAFGGERRLQADIDYTAQAAADGSGLVYRLKGADAIVARLTDFNLTSGAYRPPPAIDQQEAGPSLSEPDPIDGADEPPRMAGPDPILPEPPAAEAVPPAERGTYASRPDPETERRGLNKRRAVADGGGSGEAVVRAFYEALGAGDGDTASDMIVPEKRSNRAFRPQAISRFYGGLPEPIRLTKIRPQPNGAFLVSYRYSAGRSHCNGRAVVRLSERQGGQLIRSIDALDGC